MSSYAFSQYFYQRWTCAPEPVRATITQELEDIITLLQPETPFESFVFNTHDLDAHIDELYDNHEAEQAIAKAISDKQEEAQVAIERKRLDDEQKNQAIKNAQDQTDAKPVHEKTVQEASDANAQSIINTDNSVTTDIAQVANDSTKDFDSDHAEPTVTGEPATIMTDVKNNNNVKQDSIKAIHSKASAAISLTLKEAKLSAEHQSLIHELEKQIDDYLSEQMMLMSEDLKSWLRAEVTQHLGGQDKTVSNDNATENLTDTKVH